QTFLIDTVGAVWDVEHGPSHGTFAPLLYSEDDVTVIAPHTTLKQRVRPRAQVRAGSRPSGPPLVSVECGPVRCSGDAHLVGKTVGLETKLRRDGEERQFVWSFRITRTTTSWYGSRPTDEEFYSSPAQPDAPINGAQLPVHP